MDSGTTRERCLRSRASTHCNSSKSWTSPAIFTSTSDVSKRVMVFTPLLPASTARQNAAFPIPLGLTIPIPVITARLSIGTDSIIDVEFWVVVFYAFWNLHFYTVLPFEMHLLQLCVGSVFGGTNGRLCSARVR